MKNLGLLEMVKNSCIENMNDKDISMISLCIESSHKRGMGHLFRALNFIKVLDQYNEPYIVFINDDAAAVSVLKNNSVNYETVNLSDVIGNWESEKIRRHNIDIWLNDRFESSYEHCINVKKTNTLLSAIDDCGSGTKLVDIHFVGMMFGTADENIGGKRILRGLDYCILNSEIGKFRRLRTKAEKVIVSLGGSDTYGVTVKAVELLRKHNIPADIIIGPSFRHMRELERVIDEKYRVMSCVPSLVETFSNYDIAVTGGGVTCLEANAAGLPCIVIANELHEIDTCRYIERMGGAVFAGYYTDIDDSIFDIRKLDICCMSEKCINSFPLNGAENIYKVLKDSRNMCNV